MIILVKRFFEWIKLKETLHNTKSKTVFFAEREVWWCFIGENIGGEINGKSKYFSRPILIFKKLSKNLFLGIPVSSQPQRVNHWFVPIVLRDNENYLILSQSRVFDVKRLSTKMGVVDRDTYKKAKRAFARLFL